MQKKSKIIIGAIIAAIVLVVGVFTVVALTGKGNSIEKEVGEKISLGQKFLLDLEYDKAVAEFQAVIDIEPKNVDAYMGLASAYIGMGEKDKAIETLEKGLVAIKEGYDELSDEDKKIVDEKIEKIEKKIEESNPIEEVTTTVPETTEISEITTADNGRVYNDDGTYSVFEYYDNGENIKKETVYSSSNSMIRSIEYDEDGNITKLSNFEDGWYCLIENYEDGSYKYSYYDVKDDRLLEESTFDSNKIITEYISYTYTYDGMLEGWWIFDKFNENGDKLSGQGYFANDEEGLYDHLESGDLIGKYAAEYYENGNIKREIIDYWDFYPARTYVYTYDENGKLKEKALYQGSIDGEPMYVETY